MFSVAELSADTASTGSAVSVVVALVLVYAVLEIS